MHSALAGRVVAGHPVDVASGVMVTGSEDFRLPGRMELSFTRNYSTALLQRTPGVLGPGWAHDLELTLTMTSAGYLFAGPGGTETLFEGTARSFLDGRPIRALGSFSELSWENGRFVVTRWNPETHDAERFVFMPGDAQPPWPCMSIEAAMGRAIDLQYDAQGRLAFAFQRREGRGFVFTHDMASRLVGVTFRSATGYQLPLLSFAYDDLGRLVAATDPMGSSERYTYDAYARMVTEQKRSGGVFNFKYDLDGRCVLSVGGNGYDRRTFKYLPKVGYTEVQDSVGGTWRYWWTGDGQVIRVQTPLGSTFVTEYDEFRRIVAHVDAGGGRIEFTYDDAGNRSSITTPLGLATKFVYNAARQLVRQTDAAGGEWQVEYDARNYLVAAGDPAGNRWQYELNPEGEMVRTVNPLGGEMRCRYGAYGELLEASDWEGNLTHLMYNDFGWIEQVIDPAGRSTRYEYDSNQRVIAVRWSDGRSRRFSYDTWNNLTEIVEADGSRSRYRYGTCGRLKESTDPLGRTLQFIWGTEPEQLLEIRNAGGEMYRFEYDADGRAVAEVDFSGRRLTTRFDANGFYTAQSNGDGESTLFERDALGRLLKKQLPDGGTVSFEYDALGLMVSAQNASCRVEFTRDPLGRVLQEKRDDHVVASRYDALGNRVELSSTVGHRASYAYDRNGRLARLVVGDSRPIEFRHDVLGQEIARSLTEDLVLRQEYDAAGRLLEQRVAPAGRGVALIRRRYDYDEASRVRHIGDERWGLSSFSYDAAGELTAADVAGVGQESFAFDASENVTRMSRVAAAAGSSAQTTELEYAPGNRLSRRDDAIFEYDPAGRPVRKIVGASPSGPTAWGYAWDGEGWLQSITMPDGVELRYEYDAFGRRIRAHGPAGITEFVWDGDVLCHELDAAQPVATWVFDPDGFAPLAFKSGTSLYHAVVDHQGTPRELVSERGQIAWAQQHSAWGDVRVVGEERVHCRLGFPGQWFDDETGLCYNRFRYYDPAAARYLTPDPQGLRGGFNLYRYVAAPTAWTDPFGLETEPVNGRQYTFDRDAQGRVVRAQGPLCNPNRVTDPQRDVNAQRRLSSGTGSDAGHLIGNQFGGPGGGGNLVLMCPSMNRYGSWKRMENQLVGLTRNNSVTLTVTVHYKGDSERPSHFTVDAEITDRNGRTTRKRWTHKNCRR